MSSDLSGSPGTIAAAQASRPAIDFASLSVVTAALRTNYGQTSFRDGGTVLFTDLAVANAGTYAVAAPLVVAIAHLLRIALGWEVVVNGLVIPMWVSWIGLVVSGGLAIMVPQESRAPASSA